MGRKMNIEKTNVMDVDNSPINVNNVLIVTSFVSTGARTIKKNTNSTQNKPQTHRAKQHEVTSFLSIGCELSTETCSKNVYSLGPRLRVEHRDMLRKRL